MSIFDNPDACQTPKLVFDQAKVNAWETRIALLEADNAQLKIDVCALKVCVEQLTCKVNDLIALPCCNEVTSLVVE